MAHYLISKAKTTKLVSICENILTTKVFLLRLGYSVEEQYRYRAVTLDIWSVQNNGITDWSGTNTQTRIIGGLLMFGLTNIGSTRSSKDQN